MRKERRQTPFAEEGQEYAKVTKMLGNCRVSAETMAGAEVQCKIRGSMQRRVYLAVGDWVLVAARDFTGDMSKGLAVGDKADVIDKYTPQEVAYLQKIGEICQNKEVQEDDDDLEALIHFEDIEGI